MIDEDIDSYSIDFGVTTRAFKKPKAEGVSMSENKPLNLSNVHTVESRDRQFLDNDSRYNVRQLLNDVASLDGIDRVNDNDPHGYVKVFDFDTNILKNLPILPFSSADIDNDDDLEGIETPAFNQSTIAGTKSVTISKSKVKDKTKTKKKHTKKTSQDTIAK